MACPICLCESQTRFYEKKSRQLVICERCRHICWETLPTAGDLATYYRQVYTKTHSQDSLQESVREYYKGHVSELLHWAGRTISGTAIMDYGCSIPVFLEEAQRAKVTGILGVDYAQEVAEYGRQRGIRIIAPNDIPGLPDRSIDIVRFSHTLEHTIRPRDTLEPLLAKLKPGALVYITQPSFPVFYCRNSDLDLMDTVYPEHLHFFSPLSLIRLVESVGLTVKRFFTHQAEEDVLAKYTHMIDLEYARERLAAYEGLGERALHALGNYPYYVGQNSGMCAYV